MKVKNFNIVYDNPLPQLRSRQSAFPFLAEDDNGNIYCSFQIGEAFESVDGKTVISVSKDCGKTWGKEYAIVKNKEIVPISENSKITYLGNNDFICLGYAFYRGNPELPIGNPETGGLLDDFVYAVRSTDGKTWSDYQKIPTHWANSTEASAPITKLSNGDLVTPITGFPSWNGKMKDRLCGRLLVSKDNGKTWNDDVICMEFENDVATCYEQRLCQLETGEIIVIGWNENVKTGERMNNHYTVSYDNGKTFSNPIDTGVRGQASSVCALGGSKFLALHAKRRDTDRPGVYGYIVDFKNKKWEIEQELLIWEPSSPMIKDKNMAEIFSYLKFGQPGAIKLKSGNVLISFWFAEQGQYKIAVTELEL